MKHKTAKVSLTKANKKVEKMTSKIYNTLENKVKKLKILN